MDSTTFSSTNTSPGRGCKDERRARNHRDRRCAGNRALARRGSDDGRCAGRDCGRCWCRAGGIRTGWRNAGLARRYLPARGLRADGGGDARAVWAHRRSRQQCGSVLVARAAANGGDRHRRVASCDGCQRARSAPRDSIRGAGDAQGGQWTHRQHCVGRAVQGCAVPLTTWPQRARSWR